MTNKYKLFPAQLALIFLFATHICSPQTGIWTELQPINSPSPRMDFGMAEIGDRKLIIFGGMDDNKIFDETWIYDFKENNWMQVITDRHPSKRYSLRMARITNNKVLLFGGSDPINIITPGFSDETWIFDLDSLKWKEMEPQKKPVPRYDFSMSQLSENRVILFGGIINDTANPQNLTSDETWIYDLNKNNWTAMSDLYEYKRPSPCNSAMLAQIDTGKVLFYGGWGIRSDNKIGLLDETWLFEYITLKWKKIEPKSKSIPIGHSSMANIHKNEVIFWGGDIDSHGNYNEPWLFNINDSSWKNISTNIKPDGRYMHCISKLGQDSILLFGGLNNKIGTMHNDTWLLSMDSVVDVFEIENTKKDITKSFLLIDKNVTLIINAVDNFTNGKLYDIYGKLIYSFSPNFTNGNCTIDLNLQQLSSGIYFIVLFSNKGINVIKILIDN